LLLGTRQNIGWNLGIVVNRDSDSRIRRSDHIARVNPKVNAIVSLQMGHTLNQTQMADFLHGRLAAGWGSESTGINPAAENLGSKVGSEYTRMRQNHPI
jgi:hypothetical protein